MALSNFDSPSGGRRAVDSELPLVPMIDLLFCCISFLMVCAVWSHWARQEASVSLPGPAECDCSMVSVLEVSAVRDLPIRLSVKRGGQLVSQTDVKVRSTDLAGLSPLVEAIEKELSHIDRKPGKAVTARLKVDDRARFGEVSALLDALSTPKLGDSAKAPPAVNVVLVAN